MPYAIVLSTSAKKDLAGIRSYITDNDSGEAARQVLLNIRSAINSLEELPARGHVPPELRQFGIEGPREIHSGPYRIMYDVSGQTVFILAVLDARRNLTELLLARMRQ